MTREHLDFLLLPGNLEFLTELRADTAKGLKAFEKQAFSLEKSLFEEQIDCFRKASDKLPGLSKILKLYDKTALEQCSGEQAAIYKSSLLKGKRFIDMTGGLGIDSIFFSRNFEEVYYCEKDPELCEIFRINLSETEFDKIKIIEGNSLELLNDFADKYFDAIYIDPSRRSEGRRSVDLKFLEPDLAGNLNLILQKSHNILIKLSPAFDILEGIRRFPGLGEFILVSSGGELKEALLLISDNVKSLDEIKVSSVILRNSDPHTISFSRPYMNMRTLPSADTPGTYLYDVDPSISKAGNYHLLADTFSSLRTLPGKYPFLTSDTIYENFPGRIFRIISSFGVNKKKIRTFLKSKKIGRINIIRKNFDGKTDELRKFFGLKEGGDHYLIFTKLKENEAVTFFSEKVC
ncbi:MAG: RsmD family RNA methyltransferase [Ignavibacteriales bacterium]|nr:RsmD family RNA methyltransferase [Ignavibacteriales bacterium]MCF8315317.1 RsmD family RNA methyltransferase [Ignavibacteriales bacterium]MCF8436791.1 RsmD family RNA methyltransferase [Ignavibacteriales bacterium]